jgi:hypothetical protein
MEGAMSLRMGCFVVAGVLLAGCAEGPRVRPALPAGLSSLCAGDVWRGSAVVLGPEAIAYVEPLYANLSSHGSLQARLRGAIVHVKPVAGLTQEVLTAMIACHREALARGLIPSVASDPYGLDEDRMSVKVELDPSGLLVKLGCDSVDDAKQVLADVCVSACPSPAQL